MAKFRASEFDIYLENASSVPDDFTPTAISAATPPVVTIADTTGIVAGDVVTFSGTGITKLDGKFFMVGTVAATTFEVWGAALTGVTTAPLGATPVATVHHKLDDMTQLCTSGLDVQAGTQNTIDVTTFCSPGTILGNYAPGAMTLNFYMDESDTAFPTLRDASEDGNDRVLLVYHSAKEIGLVAVITIGEMTPSFPIDGAAAYSFPAATSVPFRLCMDEAAS